MLPTTVLIFLIFLTAAIYCWKGHYCPGEHKKQRITIDISLSLLQLVQDLQRHRGMSMVIINNNKEFTDEFTRDIFGIEKQIQYSLKYLQEYYAAHQRILKNDQWLALLHKWVSLKACWRDLDFISNLFAHNEVINEIIDVIQKLAEKENHRLGKERTQLLSQWPQLIEHLGMLRALGVYALSSQSHSNLMNISLTMADHKQQAKQILSHETSRVSNRLLFNNTEAMLRQIDDMLVNSNLNESVKSFYNDMTLLIDCWYSSLNECIDTVNIMPQYQTKHR